MRRLVARRIVMALMVFAACCGFTLWVQFDELSWRWHYYRLSAMPERAIELLEEDGGSVVEKKAVNAFVQTQEGRRAVVTALVQRLTEGGPARMTLAALEGAEWQKVVLAYGVAPEPWIWYFYTKGKDSPKHALKYSSVAEAWPDRLLGLCPSVQGESVVIGDMRATVTTTEEAFEWFHDGWPPRVAWQQALEEPGISSNAVLLERVNGP